MALRKFSDDPKRREAEEKCLADVQRDGVHVLKVLGDAEWPEFTYSVGLFHNFQLPEIIILGLRAELAHSVINAFAERAMTGERFAIGQFASGFLEGFDVAFRSVAAHHIEPHFGWAIWFYGGKNFPIAQLVFPTTSGVWPWDLSASESFRSAQPLLETAPLPTWAQR